MGLPKDINQYVDIAAIASKFADGRMGRLEFENKKLLISWRQRFYKYRKLFGDQQLKETGIRSTPWDGIVLSQAPDSETTIILNWHKTPEFIPADNPAPAPAPIATVGDLGLETTATPSPAEIMANIDKLAKE